MNNVNKKFEQLEKIQSEISKKLDRLETKFLSSGELKLGSGFNVLDNEDEYKLQCDLENLLKERKCNFAGSSKKDKEVDKNYLQFYDCLSEINKQKFLKNRTKKTISNSSSQKNSQRKKFAEKGVGTDKPTLLTFDDPINDENLRKLNNLAPLDKINKQIMQKKQNQFLTNELVDLRVKLNGIKMKNKLFQNLLKNNEAIKNCKLMEKLITSFIEKLAINWHEIVDKIIDDLLEEEIFNLNEIELEKIKRKQLRLTKVEDILRDCPDGNKEVGNMLRDKYTVEEINNMVSSYKNDENLIYSKYFQNNKN